MVVTMGVRKGDKTGICPPPGKWDWELKISRKPEDSSLILINWCNSCNDTLFATMTLTQHKNQSGSPFWCHAGMRLQFTHVRSFACKGRLPNLLADCSTVGLYCVTITWQRTLVTVAGVLPHVDVTVERRHLGMLAGNAARQWLPIAVKRVASYECGNKHEWICSKASASL